MRRYCIRPLCFVIQVFIFVKVCSVNLSCRDEENKAVDWFVNYKLPKIERGFPGTDIAEGTAYAYISATNPEYWTLSSRNITSETSMLAKTLQTFFDKKRNTSYLFYNDDPPVGYNGTANGHMKGIIVFNGISGFWIIHSIPKFSSIDIYKYPINAIPNGQSILCVTFNTSILNQICRQLLYCNPKIYERGITDEVRAFLDKNSQTIFSKKPAFIRKPPFVRIAPLKSVDRKVFTSFAKDGQLNDDIYSSILAPALRTSLASETWRRGSGTFLPPVCKSKYTINDISSISMVIKNQKIISFKSTEDHSKWAVSQSSSEQWICIGDMNRMVSQERRGGGALCFQSMPVANAYRSLISNSDQCPDDYF